MNNIIHNAVLFYNTSSYKDIYLKLFIDAYSRTLLAVILSPLQPDAHGANLDIQNQIY